MVLSKVLMLMVRIGRWLIEEALPALAFAAGFPCVPARPMKTPEPSLQAQLAELFEVVAAEEKMWSARHRIGETR